MTQVAESQFTPIYESLGTALGAYVPNVDPGVDLDANVRADLALKLRQYGVLVFRGSTVLDDESFARFCDSFGPVHTPPASNGALGGEAPDKEAPRKNVSKRYRSDRWHTDSSFDPTPPAVAALRAVTLPENGGDTMWASMSAVYESLSPSVQSLLGELDALHTLANLARNWPPELGQPVIALGRSAVHPVVITDPVTGKKAFYVNRSYTERILDVTPHESEHLLEIVHRTTEEPEFQVRLSWDPNMVVVWDERMTVHRAVSDYEGPRTIRRVMLGGDPPAR